MWKILHKNVELGRLYLEERHITMSALASSCPDVPLPKCHKANITIFEPEIMQTIVHLFYYTIAISILYTRKKDV